MFATGAESSQTQPAPDRQASGAYGGSAPNLGRPGPERQQLDDDG